VVKQLIERKASQNFPTLKRDNPIGSCRGVGERKILVSWVSTPGMDIVEAILTPLLENHLN